MTEQRLTKDQYFIEIAKIVAKRSTCIRRNVGAVLVKDSHIISTGYNGSPAGLDHCTEETCIRTKMNIPSGESPQLCRAVHAEINCIIQAAVHGTAISGITTMYTTTFPCIDCAKILINVGVKRIVYLGTYDDSNVVRHNLIAESEMITEQFIEPPLEPKPGTDGCPNCGNIITRDVNDPTFFYCGHCGLTNYSTPGHNPPIHKCPLRDGTLVDTTERGYTFKCSVCSALLKREPPRGLLPDEPTPFESHDLCHGLGYGDDGMERKTCSRCSGSGIKKSDPIKKCTQCNGVGWQSDQAGGHSGECERCGGTGIEPTKNKN